MIFKYINRFICILILPVSLICVVIGGCVAMYLIAGEPWQARYGLVQRESLRIFLGVSLLSFVFSFIYAYFTDPEDLF